MSHEKETKRRYRLKKRAEAMAETKGRIAAAAAELHGTVGPARTTWSAVAERAGVQRHTVYRHFPTEAQLFSACSAHFFTENPLPDIESWGEIADPLRRLERALDELYAYYESTERMLGNVLRDAELIEDLRPTLAPMLQYLDDATEILVRGWTAQGTPRLVRAATRHAVDFQAWRSLTYEGRISRAEAIDLVAGMVSVAVAG